MMTDMRVNIAGVELKNPVMTASGTFGSGEEYSEFVDLNRLGAVVTKGVANVPWPGNATPRVAETYGGMMNAIGLQNPGIDVFCKRDIPFLQKYEDHRQRLRSCAGRIPGCGRTAGRGKDRYDGDQHFLPQRQRGLPRFRPGPEACGGAHGRDQKDRKAAGHHEADPERNGYR